MRGRVEQRKVRGIEPDPDGAPLWLWKTLVDKGDSVKRQLDEPEPRARRTCYCHTVSNTCTLRGFVPGITQGPRR